MAGSLDETLAEFGVRLAALDAGTVRLTRGSEAGEYDVVFGKPPYVETLAGRRGRHQCPFLVLADHVPRKLARQLIEADVQFADHSGNAYLHFGAVYIRCMGEPRRVETDLPDVRTDQVSNLMSRKRAQVIALLLAEPAMAAAPVRELARASGASTGTVSQTLGRLEEAEFLWGGELEGGRRAELLDLWAAAYPTGLGAKLRLLSLGGDPSLPDVVEGEDVQVSGEAAVGHFVEHRSLILYVRDVSPRLIAQRGWRKDREPHNIQLRQRFWTLPSTSSRQPSLAPWPIVYADLLESRDPRQVEAATELRGRHVRP